MNDETLLLQNKTLVAVLVCTSKTVKFSVDLFMLYVFIRFIQFFITFRRLEERKTTAFNKFILCIVLFLYLLTVYQAVFTFGLFIIYIKPELNTLEFYLVQNISFNLFYLKDFVIALLLSYLFYYKGMQK